MPVKIAPAAMLVNDILICERVIQAIGTAFIRCEQPAEHKAEWSDPKLGLMMLHVCDGCHSEMKRASIRLNFLVTFTPV